MRGEKTEGKMSGPLFPRLYVNDTDKGGPKPPPRNKMALYEQLSIPLQRLKDSSAATLPLPLPPVYGGGAVVDTNSVNQGHGLDNSRVPPYQTSASSYNNVRHGSFSSDRLSYEKDRNDPECLLPTGLNNIFPPYDITRSRWPSGSQNEDEVKGGSLSTLTKERYLAGSSSLGLQPGKNVSSNLSLMPATVEDPSEQSCQVAMTSSNYQKLGCEANEGGNESSLQLDVSAQRGASGGAFISPDDVVEMIGREHFWKVRRAIINQQRVLSMQVFELHRIIKIQRIFAGSRHLPTEETFYLPEPITKPSSLKEPTHNSVPENPSLLLNLIDNVPKIKRPPQTLLNNDFTSGIPKTGCKSEKIPTWNIPPPPAGNQWLVPVMSPSEGLIYKPYTEPPCPLPTLYGAFRPNIPFAPYGMPPNTSLKTVDPTDEDKDKDREMCLIYESSCIVTSERNKVDIPRKWAPEDALPLFPTVPTGRGSGGEPVTLTQATEHKKSQVIKVISRNPRLASESAARIIQLIQEERKRLL